MPALSRALLPAALALAAALAAPRHAAAQTVLAGPFQISVGGPRYYIIDAADFATARAWAPNAIGGDVATINSAAENSFFPAFHAARMPFEIGLNDLAAEGVYVWADASGSNFRNWATGEPALSNTPAADNVVMNTNGTWTPAPDAAVRRVLVMSSGPLKVPQEFPSLSAAIAYANTSGFREIELSAGTYSLSAPTAISGQLTVRARGPVTITSSPNTISVTGAAAFEGVRFIIDDEFGIIFDVALNASLTLRDSSVSATAFPSLLAVSRGSVRLERVTARSMQSLISPQDPAARFTAVGCVFRNIAGLRAVAQGQTMELVHCTLVGTSMGPARPGVIAANLSNCVVAEPPGNFLTDASLRYTLCPLPAPGPGNINAAPIFTVASGVDIVLASNSPGVDAASVALLESVGIPLVDAARQPRLSDMPGVPNTGPDQWGLDMGAYETPASLAPPPCVPDLNKDGELTFDDIQAFINAFNTGC